MLLERVKDLWDFVQGWSTTTKIVVFTTSAVTTVIVVKYVRKKRYNLPPGPRPLPFLGNILELKGVSLQDKLNDWKEKYGPVVTCYMGPKMVIFLNDFQSMSDAFLKGGSDFSSRPYLYSFDLITSGLKDIAAAPYGDVWKYQRKIASQALRKYLIGTQLEKRVYETIQPVVELMVKENKAFNPHQYMSLSVINVLHGLCFDSTFHPDDPTFSKILASLDMFSDGIGNGFLEDFFPPLRWWPTKKFKEITDTVVEFNSYIEEKMNKHRSCFNPDNITSLADTVIEAQKQALEEDDPAVAAMFTDAHAQFTVVDVFTAGVDTSRQTLDWLILALVAYPEVQKKIQQEIDDVVGDGIPGREHRVKLVYTEAVLFEILRLYYVVPIGLPHETMRDTKVGGYDIPAHVTVMTNNTAMMRDPTHWQDPLQFKPERFTVSGENRMGSKLLPSRLEGWAPFSLGHRSCIGESLAKLELVYIIACLLQKLNFTFAGDERGNLIPDMSQTPTGVTFLPIPYKVKVTRREK